VIGDQLITDFITRKTEDEFILGGKSKRMQSSFCVLLILNGLGRRNRNFFTHIYKLQVWHPCTNEKLV